MTRTKTGLIAFRLQVTRQIQLTVSTLGHYYRCHFAWPDRCRCLSRYACSQYQFLFMSIILHTMRPPLVTTFIYVYIQVHFLSKTLNKKNPLTSTLSIAIMHIRVQTILISEYHANIWYHQLSQCKASIDLLNLSIDYTIVINRLAII